MVDIQRAIIRHSVEDVIRILENEPVRGDMVPEVTAVQVLNRVSIAHLSIERAVKFLVTRAGGPLLENHNLRQQHQELLCHDPRSARFLEEVFHAAVRHYRYNANAASMTHLRSLDTYLDLAGSNRAFQDVRYWELTQQLDEMLLRRIYLSLHIELLHGLREILLAPDRLSETVVSRVERAVEQAMWQGKDLSYGPGTPKERAVLSYLEWRRGFKTWCDALAEAVQQGFNMGDDFIDIIARNSYKTLLEAADPAVRYFASTLDVLTRQPRDVIPDVEWLGPEKERSGSVKTPAGTALGFIERGPDGLWYITPLREGLVRVSAKAASQTDARCYLAILLSRPGRVIVRGEQRPVRIVGEDYRLFQRNYDQADWSDDGTSGEKAWTHKITLWEADHGIQLDEHIRIEVRRSGRIGVVEILEGTVTGVTEQEIHISGHETVDVEQRDND